MEAPPAVELRPITEDDIEAVGHFLTEHLNPRVGPQAWASAMRMPWCDRPPNHGYMLVRAGAVVGANLAFYSRRQWGGSEVAVCNLAALCVVEAERPHAVRMLRALLRQPGHVFTDFSPSGNVVALNRRLGLDDLDTSGRLLVNLPWRWSRRARLLHEAEAVRQSLDEGQRQHFDRLRGSGAASHLAIVEGDQTCYVVLRKDRRKGLPLFANVLYVSDRELFRRHGHLVLGWALQHLRTPLTLLEARVGELGSRVSCTMPRPRPKMVKASAETMADVDYLYSELTEVAW